MSGTSDQFKPTFSVDGRPVGGDSPCYFIAEIGNNHNGDPYLAKALIKESVEAGADAVKFQKRFVKETFAKELLDAPQTKNQVYGKTYGEYREAFELSLDDFKMLQAYARELGTTLFVTPFDHSSVDFLEQLEMQVYKIASFDLTNLPLLEYVASKKKPMFVSTGMASLEEVQQAVEAVAKYNDQLALLHCVSIYPTPDDKLNLRAMESLIKEFSPIPVGYSGHEKGILASQTAVALGAKVVERHITLDKRMPGPDHGTVSITPDEFKAMVDTTRRIEASMGTGTKSIDELELKTRKKHGKSVVSLTDIPKGTKITPQMLICKSPGRGYPPRMFDSVVGRVAATDIVADRVIEPSDLAGDPLALPFAE